MFTPRPVLEAREWLKRGNPRKAGEVLLAVQQDNHRDIVAARHEVSGALIRVARQEYEQHAFWGSWEALQMAQNLAPLVGEERAFYEQVAGEAHRRMARREQVQELVQRAQEWLSEGRVRKVIRILEPLLRPESSSGVSVSDIRLQKVLAEAGMLLEELENFLALIRQSLEANDFRTAWRHYQQARCKFRTDGELDGYYRRIYGGLVEEPLARAEAAVREGRIEEAERLLDQVREFSSEEEDRRKIELLLQQVAEAKRQRSRQQILDKLAAAIERRDFNTAYGLLARVYAVARDEPRLQELIERLVEAGSPEEPVPKPVVDRRQPIALSVQGEEWLILPHRELLVGGRGSRRAELRISAPLQAIHAMLARDRTGYYLRSYCSAEGRKGNVLVNDCAVASERRLVHGDRITWVGAWGKCGEWRLELPVANSLTARLRLVDYNGGPAEGNYRQVLLVDDVAVFSGRHVGQRHVNVGGFSGTLTLRWTDRGLIYELCGCRLAGLEDDWLQGPLLVPSELEIDATLTDGAMSEANFLRAALAGERWASKVVFAWKTVQ